MSKTEASPADRARARVRSALVFAKTIWYQSLMPRAFHTVAALSLLACCSVAVVPLGCMGRAVARQKLADDRERI